MRKLGMALAVTSALISGAFLFGSAQAAPNYCWYDQGWKGPGWYQCGYAWRRGHGWGGPYGWHGHGMMGPYGWRHHHRGHGCCW
jgi:hypothetical protein